MTKGSTTIAVDSVYDRAIRLESYQDGEMAEQERAITVLEDLSSVLSIYLSGGSKLSVTTVPGNLMPLVSHVHTCMQIHTSTYNTNNNL